MKLTPAQKAAKGRNCTLNLPSVCNNNPETTVLAHLGHDGSAKRNHDEKAAFACSACHDAVDLRTRQFFSNNNYRQRELLEARQEYVDIAIKRTQAILLEMGIFSE